MAAQLNATHPAETVDYASKAEDVVEEKIENGVEVNERVERESAAEIRV